MRLCKNTAADAANFYPNNGLKTYMYPKFLVSVNVYGQCISPDVTFVLIA